MAARRLLPLTLLLVLLLAVPAHARPGEEVTFEAPRDLLDPAHRESTFTELNGLGVRSLRVVLYWKDVAPAPNARVKPKLDMTNPASYDWSRYQPVLDEAHARGWKVHLTVSGPVPRWATNGARDNVTRPSPNEFRMFMQALARHFSQQVTRWSIWNEPNHPNFLGPQYDARHRPVSPTIYRGLYAAALRGLAAAGDTKPVIMGETAPTGTGRDVAPLTFLRGVLCLDAKYRKVGHCARLRIDGYAHHAYTTREGPFFRTPKPNDVMIGTLSRLTTALDRAARAGVIDRRLPIYLTEFGIQSTPDPLYGVSFQRQAEYRSYSERLAYFNPRVAAFSQYLLRDDLPYLHKPLSERYGGFESGLRTASGAAKPALAGFRLPLVAKERGRAGVSLWGIVRPATGRTTATIQYRDAGGAWRRLTTVSTNAHGVWTTTATRRTGRAWRVQWTAPNGTRYVAPPTRAYP